MKEISLLAARHSLSPQLLPECSLFDQPLDGAGVHHNPDTGAEGPWGKVVLERSADDTRVA